MILKELNRLINLLEDGKKVKGFNLSLFDIQELIRVRDDLKLQGRSETISSKVNEICLYCGIKTQNKGIGYQILKAVAAFK